ncbi:hypothetical protein M422DRAFT_775170 [Sphaerobolus stellatus SS14]|nr:hypothetical protein M422DRAFT_775170 [Sphaerobolus stellatus SS14]
MPGISHREFSAWVNIDGQALPTYQEQREGVTCSAWIPSTAGRSFYVCWKDESGARIATSGHVFIDGRDLASAIIRPGRSKHVERKGAKTSSKKIKPFKFSVLELTDDDDVADRYDPHLNNTGTIRVEITRVKLGAEVPFKGYEAEEHGTVHEKAKKMGAHCTSFGPAKRTNSTRTVSITTAPYDEENPGPHVIFLFKYRSEDLLRAQNIIPNSNNVIPEHDPEEVIVISDDSEDEGSDKEEGPARKRPRVDSAEAQGPPSSPQATEPKLEVAEEEEEKPKDMEENVSQDVEMEEKELTFGVPTLLQSGKEGESLTQPDDNQRPESDDGTMKSDGAPEEVDNIPAPTQEEGESPHKEESRNDEKSQDDQMTGEKSS